MGTPKTLQQAILYYADPENCRLFMMELRWPDGKVLCPRCGSDQVAYLPNAKVFKCYQKHDRQKFSLKVGTIFEDSPIGLEKWLPAMWLAVNCKNGISSYEVHRALGVTQKTAWFMLQRIRLAMQESGGKLGGEVEVDETFIGGKARNMHAAKRKKNITGRGPKDKAIAFGMVERGGRVRAGSVLSRQREDLQPLIREAVEAGAAIFSDELKSYEGLSDEYKHAVINHAVEYVRGNTHTNTIENFWALLKRGLHGTYISVEPFHLFRYIDEQAFRYNYRRDLNDGDRFVIAMQQIVGKRLTYKELTGKLGEGAEPTVTTVRSVEEEPF
jgi:transposase-like protein